VGTEIGGETTIILTQISTVGKDCPWIENSSFTKVRHSGIPKMFRTAQLEE
jgi:hypothetical protein